MEKQQKWILVGLHELAGIGWLTIFRLLDKLSNLNEIYDLSAGELSNRCGIELSKAVAIKNQLTEGWIHSRREACLRFGVRPLTIFDQGYPYLLTKIANKPWVLYGKGDFGLLDAPSIAIVGTRKPTPYGQRAAKTIGEQLGRLGITVVSGMARGIDRHAHVGALGTPGSTIAVMATGFDRIYPAEHLQLFRSVCEQGLVITETPLHQPAKKGLFPMRNRIIAGLTLGTLVVEAAEQSGSLITANYSADYDRSVFTLPGSIFAEQSRGVIRLMQKGAYPILDAADILEDLRIPLPGAQDAGDGATKMPVFLTPDERLVLNRLSHEPMSADEILTGCKFSLGHLHTVLLSLLMKNQIEQLPGSKYIR